MDGPPIVLYEPAFAAIQEQLNNIHSIPVQEDLVNGVFALVSLAGERYETEGDRLSKMLPALGELLGVRLDQLVNAVGGRGVKTAESDALATCPVFGGQNVAIYEGKLELGIGGEGSIQGALTMRKQVGNPKVGTSFLVELGFDTYGASSMLLCRRLRNAPAFSLL